MEKDYQPVLSGRSVSSTPQEDSHLVKVTKPFSDLQNSVVLFMTKAILNPENTTMYISAITGQIVIPETVFLKGIGVWLGTSCIIPILMPFFGFKAVLNSLKEEDAWGNSQSFSAFEHVVIFGLYVMILLCSVSMVPSIYFLFTGEGPELQDKGYITFVERFAPIGCATLTGFALALHMISVCMTIVAKEALEMEEHGGEAHGLQTKRDSWDKVDKSQQIMANKFWVKGVFIFKQYETSSSKSQRHVEEAAGLTSFQEAAKLGFGYVTVVKVILATLIAVVPLSRHRCGSLSFFEYTCEHGTVSSVRASWAMFAYLGYAYLGGCTVYVILTVSQSAIRLAERNRQLVLLALYLCSPVVTRKLLLRRYASDLKQIQCFVPGGGDGSTDWLPLKEAEQEAEDLITRQFSTDHIPKPTTLHNAVGDVLQEVRVNLADELNLHTDKEEVRKMIEESYSALARFQTLDIGVFWLLRKRVKIYTLTQSMQIQLFLMSLFGCACGVFCIGLMCVSARMHLEILMASGIFLGIVPIIVSVFNTIIWMNGLLNEETIGVMLTWKDLLETSQWQVRCLIESRLGKSYIETYFQRLKFQLDHVIQQIEKSEAPISFFGVPITKTFRNSLLFALVGLVFHMVPTEAKEFLFTWLMGSVFHVQTAPQANATLATHRL